MQLCHTLSQRSVVHTLTLTSLLRTHTSLLTQEKAGHASCSTTPFFVYLVCDISVLAIISNISDIREVWECPFITLTRPKLHINAASSLKDICLHFGTVRLVCWVHSHSLRLECLSTDINSPIKPLHQRYLINNPQSPSWKTSVYILELVGWSAEYILTPLGWSTCVLAARLSFLRPHFILIACQRLQDNVIE